MSCDPIRTIELPCGEGIPALGQGSWRMGEDPARRREEVAALRRGIELGMTLIDTAEMYADGGAEEVVGEAIAGVRDEVFLVSKVLPEHATLQGTIAACEGSLRRLGTDRLDLLLLHWRGELPLESTIEAFEKLRADGKIRHWGVSNFSVSDLTDFAGLPGGTGVQVNQVPYNLECRGIEWDLLPWCRERRLALMAYSPIKQGRLLQHRELENVAFAHGVTPAQVALAWVLRQDGLCVITKAATLAHVQENREALDLCLTDEDLARLDLAFPPPSGPRPLAGPRPVEML